MSTAERNLEVEYCGMVKKLAAKHLVSNPRFDFDDLYSIGLYAVVKAVEVRPTDTEYQESTWVYRAIETAMRDFIRSNRFDVHVSHYKQKQAHKEDSFDIVKNEATAIRLDKEVYGEDGSTNSVYDIIASGEPPPLEKMIMAEGVEILRDEISALSERERNIIDAWFFKELKLKDIAEAEGCSTQRVAQIKDRAFKKLKDGVAKRYADALL